MARKRIAKERKKPAPPGFIKRLLSWEGYHQHLRKQEKIEQTLDVGLFGLYRIIATNKRIIIVKRFPKNLIETEYENVEFAEYYTNVSWLIGMYSLGLIVLTVLFTINHQRIMDKLFFSVPFLEPLLGATFWWGLSYGAALIIAALGIGAIYYAGSFSTSLFGRLRILLFGQPPIDMVTKMSQEMQDFIQTVEQRNPTRSQAPVIKKVFNVQRKKTGKARRSGKRH